MIPTNTVKTEDKKWWQKAATLKSRLYVVYAAGIAASFSALFELAVKYGGWFTPFGVTLPIIIDLYWITALQVALDSSRTNKQRWFAAAHAFLAISLSITGNIMYHELDTGSWHMDEHAHGMLVATLACIPVVLTGTLTHLVLLAQHHSAAAGTDVPAPGSGTTLVPEPGTADLVLTEPAIGSEPVQAVIPKTTADPVPATPGPSEPVPGSGSGDAATPAVKAERPAKREPLPSRGATSAAERQALRASVLKSMTDRPQPAMEDTPQRVARTRQLLAEFREKTGIKMSNAELGKALNVSKAAAGEIRKAITEPEGEPAGEQDQEGEETA